MQIKDMQYFMKIISEGTFSAAAEKMYISQSALSQHIRKIENELGTELFDRRKHSAELTEAGEIFLQDAKHIVLLYDRMLQRIQSIDNSFGEIVRFGLSPFYSRYYLPRLIPNLLAERPTMKYSITENYSRTLEKLVLENKIDFALVPLSPQNPDLEYEVVYRETILLAVPKDHPLNDYAVPAKGFPYIDLSLFKNEPFVALQQYQKFSQMADQLCQTAGFSPRIVCETMNWDTLNTLVSSGIGVGFVPDILTTQIDISRRPCYYQIAPGMQRPYTIAYNKTKEPSLSVRFLMNNFKQTFKGMSIASETNNTLFS